MPLLMMVLFKTLSARYRRGQQQQQQSAAEGGSASPVKPKATASLFPQRNNNNNHTSLLTFAALLMAAFAVLFWTSSSSLTDPLLESLPQVSLRLKEEEEAKVLPISEQEPPALQQNDVGPRRRMDDEAAGEEERNEPEAESGGAAAADGAGATTFVNLEPQPVQRGNVDGVEYLWQLPPGKKAASGISAVLLVAHGCKHSATDWFPRSTECPDCLGLPEERAIVDMAHARGMLVVAPSSKDRSSKCWNVGDAKRVSRILLELQSQQGGTPPPPLLALGSSSGAELIGSFLPRVLTLRTSTGNLSNRLRGIVSQNKVPRGGDNGKYNVDIAAAYISLPVGTTAAKVADFVTQYRQGPTRRIHVPAVTLAETYFSDRIRTVTPEASKQMHRALSDAGLIADGRWIGGDPKKSVARWQPVLAPLVAANTEEDSLIPDASALFEVLNVAYGMHQTTRDGVAESLDWLLRLERERLAGQASSSSNLRKPVPQAAAPRRRR